LTNELIGIHFNAQGYERASDLWFQAIRTVLMEIEDAAYRKHKIPKPEPVMLGKLQHRTRTQHDSDNEDLADSGAGVEHMTHNDDDA